MREALHVEKNIGKWMRNRDGHREKKKQPEVKILGDYCWRKYNIFHKKKIR